MSDTEQHQVKKAKMEDDGLERCKYFVQRKKRYCKITVKKGRDYCGEHETLVQRNNEMDPSELKSTDRIPCPLDKNHSVYAKNLKKHLKICNARPKEQPPYINPGVNLGPEDEAPLDDFKLLDIEEDKLINDIIPKVEEIYAKYVDGTIDEMLVTHPSMDDTISNESLGPSTLKHLKQSSALLGIAEKSGFFQSDTCYIEYGAGKGQLSFFLAKAIGNLPNTKVLLVDRASPRHKKDNRIEDREIVQRLRADIADLDLKKVDLLSDKKHLVCLSKHLCGRATDLTLRCIVNGNNSCDEIAKTNGLIIALCCHHQINYRDFAGKDFLKTHGFDQFRFYLLTKMASWYICGLGMSRERRKELEENPNLYKEKPNTKISKEQREVIGWKCKRILDFARKTFMESNGFECSLKYYVDKSITLERVCLVGSRKIIK